MHGIGEGDPEVHAAYDWTQGRIALTNNQSDQLLSWAPPNTTGADTLKLGGVRKLGGTPNQPGEWKMT